MSYDNASGLGVYNQYGVRDTGTSAGFDDDFDELTLEFNAQTLGDLFIPKLVLPKNAHIQRAILTVHSAITLTGTTPTLIVGGAVPATNGITIPAAALAAVGASDVAADLTGTWATNSATGTTADERINIALGGTTPGVTKDSGLATLWIEFRYADKGRG